ncbi:acyl-CoA dehydrogenase [Mycolicibacterium arenosum]|uniref:Acyl-CoA dehydrogenase n=1 Tax=Mycolicibacterium arenosum TaxID=2952157 RepID=A0ABT1LZL7_9MYCO|nr:acyl-CoA dehydrogenase [Mycolicibacterium sp. CAU 1645]MCP9272331.1 acyl-CoA dehydrogenase [Mycolicibacterium sp. CAU 1645]
MSHYRSNLRDLEFTLFEMLDLDKVLATGAFGDLTGEGVRTLLAESAADAEGVLARAYSDGDRHPPTFDPDTHAVTLPASFKESVLAWQRAGWLRIGMPEALGGRPAPAAVKWSINEFLVGGQPAAFFYLDGPPMMDVLYSEGNAQQRHWAALAVERHWGATMVLTEPDAGSDVGAGRTKAVEQPDGTWHLDGVKRFITSGDCDDLFENIAHLTLARPVGAASGTKGLSLFLVPKYLPDPETAEPGARNGVFVTGLEHKMGLTASATCELTFGQHGTPAVGYLVGDVHNGIAQMFKIMEFARMAVGSKAIASLSSGYLNAVAHLRAQPTGLADPEVRRSLLTQKSYAEGMRALYLYTAVHQDPVAAAVVSGADEGMARRVNDLLLPLVKGVGSERSYQLLADALQLYGADGYLQDHPIEQYLRDAKIDSLYEGTTAIQAQDLFFRKIMRDRGEALGFVSARITESLAGGRAELASARAALATALADVTAMVATLTGYFAGAQTEPREIYRVGLSSVPFLLSLGDLLIGWLLLWQAEIALAALERGAAGDDADYYRGKVAAAKFFAANVLPRLSAERRIVELSDLQAMDLAEAGF